MFRTRLALVASCTATALLFTPAFAAKKPKGGGYSQPGAGVAPSAATANEHQRGDASERPERY